MIRHFVIALVALMFVLPSRTQAQTSTVAGEFSVEPPTLLSLGFDWKIVGDDNRNAAVDVSYGQHMSPESQYVITNRDKESVAYFK